MEVQIEQTGRYVDREIDERMNKQICYKISKELKYTKFSKVRINSQHICFRKKH